VVFLDNNFFEFNLLNNYFEKGLIGYNDSGDKIEFNNDVIYDANGNFWMQNCIKYNLVDDIDLINNFKKKFKSSSIFLKSGTKNSIIEAYKQYGRSKSKSVLELPKECIVFKNYIIYVGNKKITDIINLDYINLLDMLSENKNIICNNLNFFLIKQVIPYDYNYDYNYSCPTIDQLFCDWVGSEYKEQLYELIAYCMLPDYPIHRIFWLFGSGRNGKSVFMKIIEKIIGNDNICASDIHTLTDTPFGTSQLYTKLVCYIGETDNHQLEKTSILKRLSGQDLISAQFKGKPLFTFNNIAKIIISTNSLPQTIDRTDGYYSRQIIINFKNKFDESEDILSKIPDSEYVALANICVAKLKSLLLKRKFFNEKTIYEKRIEYEKYSNPLNTFIEDFVEITENNDEYIFVYDLYQKYSEWLNNNGYSDYMSKTLFSQKIHSMGIITEKVINYNIDGNPRIRAFIGIKYKENNTIIQENNTIIHEDKVYNSEEIYNLFKEKNKISDINSKDEIIKILKKNNYIYEVRSGEYKLI